MKDLTYFLDKYDKKYTIVDVNIYLSDNGLKFKKNDTLVEIPETCSNVLL